MGQNINFPPEKLSSPIEYLNLDSRSCNILKRIGIHRVSQIIIAGKPHILSVKNMGDLLANRIFYAISEYLDVPEDELSSDEIKKMALLEEQKNPLNPLSMAITVLDLSSGTIRLLKNTGVITVNQLIEFRTKNYNKDGRFGRFETRKINRALSLYLARARIEIPDLVVESTATVNVIPPTNKIETKATINNLDLCLELLEINERAWLVVHFRAIHLLTLEEIAIEIGGVTRERVRQIIELVNEKVQSKINSLAIFCDFFDEQAKLIRKRLKNSNPNISDLVNEFITLLPKSNLVATEESVEKVISLIRLLVILDKPWAREFFGAKRKELTFLVCLAEPAVEKNEKVHEFLELEKVKNKRVTYKEIARMVLSDAKRPLHWTEIAEKGYKLNKRERFETRALYHVLLAHEDVFVRVGQGTYELAEWGSKQVEPYTDIIASVLRQEDRSVPFDFILAKVSAVRPVKRQTVIMYLDMHPRFYKSINGTYGLRTWLPPREKQNLRTPEWLVEDSKSFERVERSKQRGYDVDSIVDNDKLT